MPSPDLRARFIRSETALFKHRFETDDKTEQGEFLKTVNVHGKLISGKERIAMDGEFRKCYTGRDNEYNDKEPYYMVCLCPS